MRILVALTLAYAAFAFGGAEGSGQFVLSLMVGLLLLLLAWRLLFSSEQQLVPNWMWLPFGLILLVTLFQLVPLPRSVVEVIAPARLAQFEPVLAGETIPELVTLSSAPSATRHALRLAMLASAVLMAIASCVRTRRDIEIMLLVVFGLGCLESILAVAQMLTGADRLYWMIDPGKQGMMTAGSFVNHSHFSQLVNLAIGAGVGLLLMRQHSAEHACRHTQWAGGQGWMLAGLAACTFAVCLSLSRSGILSLAIAASLVGSALAMRKPPELKGWTLSLIPAGVFALLLLFGLDGFYQRLATLRQAEDYQDRWALAKASLAAGADYPLLGTGLGTYAHVFPAYDTTSSASVAAYADNDYAQLFVETGLVGVAILLLFAGLVLLTLLKCLNCRWSSTSQVAWGLMIGLVAIGIQSATDFGQRLPGVFLVTATLLGILSRLPHAIRHELGEGLAIPAAAARRGLAGWSTCLAGAATMVMAMAWVVAGAHAHYQAEAWWAAAIQREARLRELDWKGTDADYAELLLATENRVAWEPDDARARFQLNLARWVAINRSEVVQGGELSEETRRIVEQITSELAQSRRMVPCFAPPYLLEGQLRSYVLGDTQGGGRLIARAAQLDVGNPQVQLRYGEWSAYHGSADLARQALRRAVTIDGHLFTPVARILIDVLRDVPTAITWAGADLARLEMVAGLLEESPRHADMLAELRAHMEQLELRLARRGEATPAQLARLGNRAAKVGDHEAAATYYRQALSKQFHMTEARLGLAHALRAQGKYDEAMREVKTCLRRDPHNTQARRLAERLALEVSLPESERVSPL